MFLYDFSFFFSLFPSFSFILPLPPHPYIELFCGSWVYYGFSSGNLLRPWEAFYVVLTLFLCVTVRCLSLVSSLFNSFRFLFLKNGDFEKLWGLKKEKKKKKKKKKKNNNNNNNNNQKRKDKSSIIK